MSAGGGYVAAHGACAVGRARAGGRRGDGLKQRATRPRGLMLAAFRTALAKLGWTAGRHPRIELRWCDPDPDTIRTFAKELVDLRCDAILGQGTPVTGVLVREMRTIPIVFVTEPIRSAAALPRASRILAATLPASRMTLTMGGKWLELLKEVAPRTVACGDSVQPGNRCADPLIHALH